MTTAWQATPERVAEIADELRTLRMLASESWVQCQQVLKAAATRGMGKANALLVQEGAVDIRTAFTQLWQMTLALEEAFYTPDPDEIEALIAAEHAAYVAAEAVVTRSHQKGGGPRKKAAA